MAPAAARLVLLGTGGGAYPKARRCGYANAVVVGDAVYLVDCGEGVHRQLWRAGLTVNERFGPDRPLLKAIFVTHLHADHIMDLANLVQGSWPSHVIDVYGPAPAVNDTETPGIRATIAHLWRAFAYNIALRVSDEGRDNVADSIRVHEIGVRRDGYAPDFDLGVTGDGSSRRLLLRTWTRWRSTRETTTASGSRRSSSSMRPCFRPSDSASTRRADAVAFSGDTGHCDNVVRLAEGADILVHEVIDVDRLTERLRGSPNFVAVRNHLAMAHSSPEEVGDIATRAGVGTLVLSHLVPGDGDPSDAEWVARVRPHFDGEIICGVDLDELALSPAPERTPD